MLTTYKTSYLLCLYLKGKTRCMTFVTLVNTLFQYFIWLF